MRRRADECAQLVGVANNQTSVLDPEPKFGMSDCRPVPFVRFAPLSVSTLRPGRGLLCRRRLSLLLTLDRHQHLLLTRRPFTRLPGRLFRRLGLLSGTSADTPPQRFHQVDDILAARALLRP